MLGEIGVRGVQDRNRLVNSAGGSGGGDGMCEVGDSGRDGLDGDDGHVYLHGRNRQQTSVNGGRSQPVSERAREVARAIATGRNDATGPRARVGLDRAMATSRNRRNDAAGRRVLVARSGPRGTRSTRKSLPPAVNTDSVEEWVKLGYGAYITGHGINSTNRSSIIGASAPQDDLGNRGCSSSGQGIRDCQTIWDRNASIPRGTTGD